MSIYNSSTNEFVTSSEFYNGYYQINVIFEGNYTVKIYDYLTNVEFVFNNITFTSPSSEYNFEIQSAIHTIQFDIKKYQVYDWISTGCWIKIIDENNTVYQDNSFYDGDEIFLVQGNYTLYAYGCTIWGYCDRENPVLTTNLNLSNNQPYQHIITIRFSLLGNSIDVGNVTYSNFVLIVKDQNNNPVKGLNVKIWSNDYNFTKYYVTNNNGVVEDWLIDGKIYTVKGYIDNEWNYKKQDTLTLFGNKTIFWKISLTNAEKSKLNQTYNQSIGITTTETHKSNNEISEDSKNYIMLLLQNLFSTKVGISIIIILAVGGVIYSEGKESKYAIVSSILMGMYFTYIGWLPSYITLLVALVGIGLMSDKVRNIIISKRGG